MVAVTVTFLTLTEPVALLALATAILAAEDSAESKEVGAAVMVWEVLGTDVVDAQVAAVGRSMW